MAVLSYGSFAHATSVLYQPDSSSQLPVSNNGSYLTGITNTHYGSFTDLSTINSGTTTNIRFVAYSPVTTGTAWSTGVPNLPVIWYFQMFTGQYYCAGTTTAITGLNLYDVPCNINVNYVTAGTGADIFIEPVVWNSGIYNMSIVPGFYMLGTTINNYPFVDIYDTSTPNPPPIDTSTLTHFIVTAPVSSSTVPNTTSVGATLYANPTDFDPNVGGRLSITFSNDSSFACINSGAVYDAIATCTGSSSPSLPFTINFDSSSTEFLIGGRYNLYATTTFNTIGAWTGVYNIQQASSPWYFFGLNTTYNTLVTKTVHFIVSTSSVMDIARAQIASVQANIASTTAHAIASVLASTTAQWGTSCQPFSSSFNMGDCLTLTFWPGDQALSDDFTIIKETPPWGYVFRVIDILNATTSTTTLPTIDYTFASSSPLSADIGDIHFDPFGLIQQSGTLINEMHSDQAGSPNVWSILMPIVQIFVYLVLLTMIIHDLTGVYNHGPHKESRGVNNDNEK